MEVVHQHQQRQHQQHQQQQQLQQIRQQNLQKAAGELNPSENHIGTRESTTIELNSNSDGNHKQVIQSNSTTPAIQTKTNSFENKEHQDHKINHLELQQPKMAFLRINGHHPDEKKNNSTSNGVVATTVPTTDTDNKVTNGGPKMASLSPGGKSSRRRLSAVKSLSSNFLDKLSHMLLRKSASSLSNSSSASSAAAQQNNKSTVEATTTKNAVACQQPAPMSLVCGCADGASKSASSSVVAGIEDSQSADQLQDRQQMASTPCMGACQRHSVNWSRSSAMNLASPSLGDSGSPRFVYSASVGDLGANNHLHLTQNLCHHRHYHNIHHHHHHNNNNNHHHHHHHQQFEPASSPELGGLGRTLAATESAPMPALANDAHDHHHHHHCHHHNNYLATPSIRSDNSSSMSVKLETPTSRKSSQKEKRKRQKEAERVEKLRLLVSYLRSGSQHDHLQSQNNVLDNDELQYHNNQQHNNNNHHNNHINNAGSLSPTATNTTIGTCYDASIRSSNNSTACSSSLNLQNSPPKLFYIGDFERQSTNANQNQYTVTLNTLNQSSLGNQQRQRNSLNTIINNNNNAITPSTISNTNIDANANGNMNGSCISFGTSSIATTLSTAASPSSTNLDTIVSQPGSLAPNASASRSSSSAWSNPQNLATWIDNEVNSLVSDLEATRHLVKTKKGGSKKKWLSSSFTRRSSSGAHST